MYNGAVLSSEARERLREFEEQERIPIRCVPVGTGHECSWPPYMRYCEGFTQEECETVGVTITSVRVADNLPTEAVHIEDDDGYTIGGYVSQAIYVVADDTYALLDGVLPVEAMIAAIRECVSPELLAEAEQQRIEAGERALREFVQRTYNDRIANVREAINAQTALIATYQTRITNAMRSLHAEQEILNAALAARESDPGDRVLAEYELLKNHARVERVRFDGGQSLIITTTDDLRITRDDTGESRYLGQFEITLGLDSMGVSIRNLTNRRGGRDHPHITDGDPCFGNHGSEFSALLARGEFYTWFECILQYLETLNLEDEYGAYGAYWFDIPDERPEAVEAA